MPAPRPADLQNRALGAYLGLAVGDALGATVEFLTPGEIRRQFARAGGAHKEIIGGGWLNLKPGQTTDDTAMSLALGEALLAGGGRITALAAARAFDEWMRAKPIDIGNTVRRNLLRFRSTGEAKAPESEHDAGNGAVMRVLPVALATFGRTKSEIVAAFEAQAHVTHNNPLSDAGGLAVIALIHAALAASPWPELKAIAQALAAEHPQYAWNKRQQENPGGYVVETLVAVLQAFFATDSFETCLIDVVNRGGDADTTGAIAGMIAGAWHGAAAIPRRWQKALNPVIAQRCREQAEKLMAVSASAP